MPAACRRFQSRLFTRKLVDVVADNWQVFWLVSLVQDLPILPDKRMEQWYED
jgi:hypothetical protein